GVAITDECGPTELLRRQRRVQGEQPISAAQFEVRVDRNRLDLGATDEAVARVMTYLKIVDLRRLRVLARVLSIAIVETQIVVVGEQRPEHVVPGYLGRDVRVVHVDQRERLACDV